MKNHGWGREFKKATLQLSVRVHVCNLSTWRITKLQPLWTTWSGDPVSKPNKQKHFYTCSPLLLVCLTHYTARCCLCNTGSRVARQQFTLEPLIPEPMFFIPNISEACSISLWSKTYTQKLSSKETLNMPQNTNLLLILIMSGHQLQCKWRFLSHLPVP